MKLAIGLVVLGTTIGCVTEPSSDDPDACEGKCDDGTTTTALSSAMAKLLVSSQYVTLVEQLGEAAASVSDPRRLAIRGVAERADAITFEIVSSSVLMFPAIERVDGYIDATLDGDRVTSVQFRRAGEGAAFEATRTLDEAVGLVLVDSRYAASLREATGSLAVRRLFTEPADGETTVVVDVIGLGEIVARVEPGVERPASVRWLQAWPGGVLVDDTLHTLPERSFFPGNGYFLFDDRDAFRAQFWSKYAAPGAPEPYIGSGDRVLGVVVSYTPYAGKSMKVEAVRETDTATVVEVMVRWDAFGCFEALDDIQLFDVIKLPRTAKPVQLVVRSSTGPGCNTGISLPPPPPPRIELEVPLSETPDQFFICDAPGGFRDPFTSCEARATL